MWSAEMLPIHTQDQILCQTRVLLQQSRDLLRSARSHLDSSRVRLARNFRRFRNLDLSPRLLHAYLAKRMQQPLSLTRITKVPALTLIALPSHARRGVALPTRDTTVRLQTRARDPQSQTSRK